MTAEVDVTGDRARWPLYVDLDRTLMRTDLLWETFVAASARNPLVPFLSILWLMQGIPTLKRKLAETARLSVDTLPLRDGVVRFLAAEREKGAPIYLATAADRTLAEAVAARVGLFDGVLATDTVNNKGRVKLARIAAAGPGPFRYIGDSMADAPLMGAAAAAGLVNPPRRLRAAVDPTKIDLLIDEEIRPWRELLRALRPHQWVKNLLVFVAVVAANAFDTTSLLRAFVAFVAFCLTASAVYIVNDLCDLAADRVHVKKRERPFAAGRLPIEVGIAVAPLLFAGGLAVALVGAPPALALVVAAYALATFAYSLALKRVEALDVVMLGLLFTVRVIGGTAAIAVVPSFWLLSFSFLLFLSLAMTKRYSELYDLRESGASAVAGRGYRAADLPIIGALGASTGALSVLVFALYINSDIVSAGFAYPALLWPVCTLLLYWIVRIWIHAGRGEVDQDPIVHVAKDPVTWIVAVLSCGLFLAAKALPIGMLG